MTDINIKLTAQDVSAGAFRSYKSNLDSVGQSFGTFDRSAQAASSAVQVFGRFAGVALAGLSAKEIVGMADAWTNMQNRLRLVTSSQAELSQASNDVFNIAQKTSQQLGTTGDVYQRFAQNTKALGLAQADVARLTETTAKAVAISGASAASAEAGLMQFGQALGSGVLRGEEFNSIMEQTPGLADALATGLGVARGEMRAMAQNGELTSARVIAALRKAGDSVDTAFGTRVKTVAQSFVELENAATRVMGEMSTGFGASSGLASAIGLVTQNLDTMANVGMVAAAAGTARLVASLSSSGVEMVRTAAAAAAKTKADLASAQGALRAAEATKLAAAADLDRANVAVASAQAQLQADRAVQQSGLARLQFAQEQLAAERALEAQRMRAQISETGRQMSATRLGEIRLAEVAITRQVEAAEKSLAATTVATSAAMQAALSQRTVAVVGAAEAATKVAATTAGVTAATAAVTGFKSAATAALGLFGGPAGLVISLATVAAGWLLFRTNTDEAARSLVDVQQPLDRVVAKFKELSRDQQQAALVSVAKQQAEAVRDANKAYEDLRVSVTKTLFSSSSDGMGSKRVMEFSAALNEARSSGGSLSDVIKRFASTLPISPETLTTWQVAAGNVSTLDTAVRTTTEANKSMQGVLQDVNSAARTAAAGMGMYSDALIINATQAIDKAIAGVRRQIALVGKTSQAATIRYDLELGDAGPYAGATEIKKAELRAEADLLEKREKAEEARKKAATASGKSDTSAKAEKERLTKAASEYVDKLQEQLDGVKEMTAWDKVWYDLANGNIVLSGKQVDKAFELANAVDAKKESEEEAARVLNQQNALLSAQRDLMAQIDGYDVELTSMGMGQKAAEEMQGRLQIMQTYVSRIRDLEDQQRNALASNTDDTKADGIKAQYDAQILVQQQYQTKALDEYSRYVARKTELEADWTVGVSQAWQNYVDSAANMSSRSEELATRAFSSMEDAAVEFATTGKASFKSLADVAIAELIRIQFRQAMVSATGSSGLWSSLAGIAGGLFGGGGTGVTTSAVGGYESMVTTTLAPLSEGGFTGAGGKYEPKGVVHGGEFVINAASTSKLGLGFLEQLNGYADGGYVTDAPVAVRGLSAPAASVKAAAPIVVSPVINIDSRTDQSQVYELVQEGVKAAIAQAFDEQGRGVN
ncbi:phage tail tape measure protein [Comamonadaceae bacterium PP-2]